MEGIKKEKKENIFYTFVDFFLYYYCNKSIRSYFMERSVATKLHKELNDAINEVLQKYGYTLSPSSMRYGDYDISMSIKAKAVNENGKKSINPTVMYWAREELSRSDVRWNDVPKEDIFNKKWYIAGLGFCSIEDFNSRRRKYPFDVKTEDGRSYRVTSNLIKFEH